MAIDPDVGALLDGVYARLASLETVPDGSSALGAVGLADMDSVVNLLDVLAATSDDEDTRLADRLAVVDFTALPSVPLPGGGGSGASAVDVGIRYVASSGNDSNDGYNWDTALATVSAAATLDPYPRHIRIGPGKFIDAAIPWRRGMTIEGSGPGATDVWLRNGANTSLFVTDPTLSATEFMHWSSIKNMRLRGDERTPGANTAGSGIEFNLRTGELCNIENIVFLGFPESGIQCNRGGQPVNWSKLAFFGNGVGINLERTGSDIWNSVNLFGISGDANPDGLIRLFNARDKRKESMTIFGLKAELGAGPSGVGGQTDVVVLDTTNCPVAIIGGATQNHPDGGGNSVVKLVDSNSTITIQNVASDYTNWIDNGVKSIPTASPTETMPLLVYANGVEQFRAVA